MVDIADRKLGTVYATSNIASSTIMHIHRKIIRATYRMDQQIKKDFFLDSLKNTLVSLFVTFAMWVYMALTETIYIDFRQANIVLPNVIGFVFILTLSFLIRATNRRYVKFSYFIAVICVLLGQYHITRDQLRYGLDNDNEPKIVLALPKTFKKNENEAAVYHLKRQLPKTVTIDGFNINLKIIEIDFSYDIKESYLATYMSTRADVIGLLALNENEMHISTQIIPYQALAELGITDFQIDHQVSDDARSFTHKVTLQVNQVLLKIGIESREAFHSHRRANSFTIGTGLSATGVGTLKLLGLTQNAFGDVIQFKPDNLQQSVTFGIYGIIEGYLLLHGKVQGCNIYQEVNSKRDLKILDILLGDKFVYRTLHCFESIGMQYKHDITNYMIDNHLEEAKTVAAALILYKDKQTRTYIGLLRNDYEDVLEKKHLFRQCDVSNRNESYKGKCRFDNFRELSFIKENHYIVRQEQHKLNDLYIEQKRNNFLREFEKVDTFNTPLLKKTRTLIKALNDELKTNFDPRVCTPEVLIYVPYLEGLSLITDKTMFLDTLRTKYQIELKKLGCSNNTVAVDEYVSLLDKWFSLIESNNLYYKVVTTFTQEGDSYYSALMAFFELSDIMDSSSYHLYEVLYRNASVTDFTDEEVIADIIEREIEKFGGNEYLVNIAMKLAKEVQILLTDQLTSKRNQPDLLGILSSEIDKGIALMKDDSLKTTFQYIRHLTKTLGKNDSKGGHNFFQPASHPIEYDELRQLIKLELISSRNIGHVITGPDKDARFSKLPERVVALAYHDYMFSESLLNDDMKEVIKHMLKISEITKEKSSYYQYLMFARSQGNTYICGQDIPVTNSFLKKVINLRPKEHFWRGSEDRVKMVMSQGETGQLRLNALGLFYQTLNQYLIEHARRGMSEKDWETELKYCKVFLGEQS